MTSTIGLVLAIVAALVGGGGVVGLLTWIFGSGRTTGKFEARVDQLIAGLEHVGKNVEEIRDTLKDQDKRLAKVERDLAVDSAVSDERSGVHHIHRRSGDPGAGER